MERSSDDLLIEIEALKGVVQEYAAKIQYLVDWADGRLLLEDGSFTFPDGDTWKARDTDPEAR